MDYNEIIEAMRSTDVKVVLCRSLDAADAIETLLAERDAAVEDLRMGGCKSCKHKGISYCDAPCKFCKEIGGMSDYWEWRGPQKGDVRGDLPQV